MYLLLVARDPSESMKLWTRRTITIKALAETTIAMSEIQEGEKDRVDEIESSLHPAFSVSFFLFLYPIGEKSQDDCH